MSTDKRALLEAVNDLILDESPAYKKTALEVVGRLLAQYPVKFSGPLMVLNPLLRLQHEGPTAYKEVQALIDRKRSIAGLSPIWPEPEAPKFRDRKNEYQRQLMAKIRERAKRASDLENLQRGERDRLEGNARLEFQRQKNLAWGARRDALIEAAAEAKGRKLTKEELADIRDAFWASIDRELDELEEAIRLEMLKPHSQRRKL